MAIVIIDNPAFRAVIFIATFCNKHVLFSIYRYHSGALMLRGAENIFPAIHLPVPNQNHTRICVLRVVLTPYPGNIKPRKSIERVILLARKVSRGDPCFMYQKSGTAP